MTAVIYARYSSDSQREASIEGQLRDCKDYAEKNGITVVGTYIDRAYSAKTDDRPEFQHMIKDSAKKIFDVVLVWKLDRFARNRFDAVNYKHQLEKNGVHLVSAMEPISQGPEGIMVESMPVSYTHLEVYKRQVFDYIFMFPMGLGLAGAALATAVSPIISISICSRHFFKKENSVQFVRQRPSARLLVVP